MYPSLSDLLQDVFGIHVRLPIQTFGFFVAIAFLAAAYVLTKELMRREKLGWIKGVAEKYWVGKPPTVSDVLLHAFIGFVLGYKLVGAIWQWDTFVDQPQAYLLSGAGSMPSGILLALLFGFFRYRNKKKQQLAKPILREEMIMPHQRVGDFTVIAAIGGLIGAKIFDSLENWHSYMQDPLHSFFSFSGLTFYGGLIVAGVGIAWYAHKKGINLWHLADAFSPAMMLAYGLGRIGCHMAGDGDWGIYNSAYLNDGHGRVVPAPPGGFQQALHQYQDFFLPNYGSFAQVPHAYFLKPHWLSFLPDWLFAFTYPHNINNEGIPIPGCEGLHCAMLPVPVFPTPLYEITACLILFGILWYLRKRIFRPGLLTAIYLIMNGVERFLVELIRVNTKYDILGIHPTQAEIISLLLIIAGIFLIGYVNRKHPPLPIGPKAQPAAVRP